MRYIILLIMLSWQNIVLAQNLPLIQTPKILGPTFSIYVSPNGSDINPGTYTSPKKTFTAAFSSINTAANGINQFYAEIVLHPGTYYPTQTNNLVQNINRWRTGTASNYEYINIQIRGIGKVVINGDSLPTGIPLLQLMGNNICVKNLSLTNGKSDGIRIIGSAINPHHDLLLDSIQIDSCAGFGCWIEGYSNVEIRGSQFIHNCEVNEFENPAANCQWPSGLRVHRSSHINIHHCNVAYNWGEGLNTSLDNYVNIHDNIVHDNYSCNIYDHSTSNAIYAYNYIYNNDSVFFRNCINGAGRAAAGISLTNELTCTNGCFLYTNSCGSKYTCCAETDYDNAIPQSVGHLQIDSVFIYNNLIANADVSVWDAFSGFGSYGYLGNIYITHNTILNTLGANTTTQSPLSISLGTPYVYIDNIHVAGNIISVDTSITINTNLLAVSNPSICSNNWSTALHFNKNIWTVKPSVASLNFNNDTSLFIPMISTAPVFVNMLYGNFCPSDKANQMVMCGNSDLDWRTSNLFSFITDDFEHIPRHTNDCNVGALERIGCLATEGLSVDKFSVYPNPTAVSEITVESGSAINEIVIFNLNGILIKKISPNLVDRKLKINLDTTPPGVYLIKVRLLNGTASSRKLIIFPHD
jgi:hypothetical protein